MLKMYKQPKLGNRYSILESTKGFIRIDFEQDDLNFDKFGGLVERFIRTGLYSNVSPNDSNYILGIERYKYLYSQIMICENFHFNVFLPDECYLYFHNDKRFHLNTRHHIVRIRSLQDKYDTFQKFEASRDISFGKQLFQKTLNLLEIPELL